MLADFNVLLTGKMGCGKSQTGNFFMKEKVFKSCVSFSSVTTTVSSCTKNVGGKSIKVIDTPGFLDPCSLSSDQEFIGLASAIMDMPNGIDAVGLVISLKYRISTEDRALLGKLLTMKDMIPHTFLIFTHPKELAKTDQDQRQKLKELLEDTKTCPQILRDVLDATEYRYMLLEAVDTEEQEYHDTKSQELLEILQNIKKTNTCPYTCPLNTITESFEKIVNQENLKVALSKDLETVSKDLNKQKNTNNPNIYWKSFFLYLAGGLGIGLGIGAIEAGYISKATLATGASEIVKIISTNPELAKGFFDAITKIISEI